MNDSEQNTSFMLAAITDTEATIRATDTKASIALVLHGLLFGGLIGVTEHVGPSYNVAGHGLQTIVVLLLAVVLASSLASVLCLLMCVAPTPRSAIPHIPYTIGLFFVSMKAYGPISPRVRSVDASYLEKIASMDEDARLQQLAGEILALGAIRERKSTLISRGLILLGVEFIVGIAYLAVVGAHIA